MAAIYGTIDFEAPTYSEAALNGQDSWTSGGWSVTDTMFYEGAMCIMKTGSTDAYRHGTARADGRISFYARRDSTSSGNLILLLIEANDNQAIYIIFNAAGLIRYDVSGNGSGAFVTLGTYSTNTWYNIECEWRDSDKKARYRMDGGSWTDWQTVYNTFGLGPDNTYFYSSDTGTATQYLDYISEYPYGYSPGGTTERSKNTLLLGIS